MKYTPVLAITLLTLLEPITAAPIQQSTPAYQVRSRMPFPDTLPHAVPLESRDTIETRDIKYGFGEPTHFAVLPPPLSRPATCGGVEGCVSTKSRLMVRDVDEEEERLRREVRKRSVQTGDFIKDVEFSTN